MGGRPRVRPRPTHAPRAPMAGPAMGHDARGSVHHDRDYAGVRPLWGMRSRGRRRTTIASCGFVIIEIMLTAATKSPPPAVTPAQAIAAQSSLSRHLAAHGSAALLRRHRRGHSLGHLLAQDRRPGHVLDPPAPRGTVRRHRRGCELRLAGAAHHLRRLHPPARRVGALLGFPRAAGRLGHHLGHLRDDHFRPVRQLVARRLWARREDHEPPAHGPRPRDDLRGSRRHAHGARGAEPGHGRRRGTEARLRVRLRRRTARGHGGDDDLGVRQPAEQYAPAALLPGGGRGLSRPACRPGPLG